MPASSAGWSASIWCSWFRHSCWRCPTAGAAASMVANEIDGIGWANGEQLMADGILLFAPRHQLFAHQLADAAELLRRLIEHEQRALGDAEIGPVQIHLAAFDERSHERKSHQIFEAAEHRGLLDPCGEIPQRPLRGRAAP